MSVLVEHRITMMVLILTLFIRFPGQAAGQTTLGILPVKTSGMLSDELSPQQWKEISGSVQEQLVNGCSGIGTVTRLSKEHVILLLKDMPSSDPENLSSEAFRIISRKENFQYFLNCSIESTRISEKNIIVKLRVAIFEGISDMIFWEKEMKIEAAVSEKEATTDFLLKEVLNPVIGNLSEEIRKLKY